MAVAHSGLPRLLADWIVGLNADGQHDHIRGSVIPTFLHFNLPLLAAGWLAAQVL